MTEINSFQQKCKAELINKLISLRIAIPDFNIGKLDKTWFADSEVFIEADVSDYKIWIYDDGAQIEDKVFEAPDYKTEDDLIRAFIDRLASLIKNR